MPKKQLKGVVVSNKMQKTAIVAVTRLKEHRLYKKKFKVTTKYSAHDATNECQIGDKVIIQECKPISKNKCWVVLQKM
ncbi:30S ribosomal protein S17 [Patescibacteria group bacterium]|nr:30S ribosomal protein S17 [Patescibacteria group bacterium]MBU4143064.1 30S ribosomal protein S17 [Patescibacteria group bacterium]